MTDLDVLPREDVTPHPRMRARLVENRRAAGRRRLRRINMALALICSVVWAMVVIQSSLLDVDHIEVRGAIHTPQDQVRASSGIVTGEAMVGADMDGARRAVADLPWIASVEVSRSWPGTVQVAVTERVAVATVRVGSGWMLLDRDGKALEVVASKPADLVSLAGTREARPGEELRAEDRLTTAVLADITPGLRAVTVEAEHGDDGVELQLDDGLRVVLGDGRNIEEKSESALAVRQHAEVDDDRCRIDVRVETAPVLTGGPACA